MAGRLKISKKPPPFGMSLEWWHLYDLISTHRSHVPTLGTLVVSAEELRSAEEGGRGKAGWEGWEASG